MIHSFSLIYFCFDHTGLDEKFTDHFQGYLAGLSLLKDKTESERVIQCLNNCQENLDFKDLSDMPSETVRFISVSNIPPIHKISTKIKLKCFPPANDF